MNISNDLEAQVPYQKIIHYKQRLIAITELFDADLAVCLIRSNASWSVLALEGTLTGDERRIRLPEQTLRMTLEERKGLSCLEALGETQIGAGEGRIGNCLFVHTVSAMMNEATLMVVAAKHLRKGPYQEEDIGALTRYLAAFEEAGV